MVRLTPPYGKKIKFKIRFNTTHGDSGLYWRIIIDETEYLASSVFCTVPTYSEASFDATARAIKYHMAGLCEMFYLDNNNAAFCLGKKTEKE